MDATRNCSVDDCDRDAATRGMCRKHYGSWRRHNPDLVAQHRRPLLDRFIESVDASGVCWEWTGELTQRCYGRFYDNGQRPVAHLWLWEHLYGPVPDGLELDHLCRNTSCVNPAHLEAVTHRENVLRGQAPTSVAFRAGTCLRGHSMDDAHVGKNGRRCRTCTSERNAGYYQAKRSKGARS